MARLALGWADREYGLNFDLDLDFDFDRDLDLDLDGMGWDGRGGCIRKKVRTYLCRCLLACLLLAWCGVVWCVCVCLGWTLNSGERRCCACDKCARKGRWMGEWDGNDGGREG